MMNYFYYLNQSLSSHFFGSLLVSSSLSMSSLTINNLLIHYRHQFNRTLSSSIFLSSFSSFPFPSSPLRFSSSLPSLPLLRMSSSALEKINHLLGLVVAVNEKQKEQNMLIQMNSYEEKEEKMTVKNNEKQNNNNNNNNDSNRHQNKQKLIYKAKSNPVTNNNHTDSKNSADANHTNSTGNDNTNKNNNNKNDNNNNNNKTPNKNNNNSGKKERNNSGKENQVWKEKKNQEENESKHDSNKHDKKNNNNNTATPEKKQTNQRKEKTPATEKKPKENNNNSANKTDNNNTNNNSNNKKQIEGTNKTNNNGNNNNNNRGNNKNNSNNNNNNATTQNNPPSSTTNTPKSSGKKPPKFTPHDFTLSHSGPFIDIGLNLLDHYYRGFYHGHKIHREDTENVIERARKMGVKALIITAGTLQETRDAVEFIKNYNKKHNINNNNSSSSNNNSNNSNNNADNNNNNVVRLYCTAGCHPTRTQAEFHHFYNQKYHQSLDNTSPIPNIHQLVTDYFLEFDNFLAANSSSHIICAVGECGLDYDRLHFSTVEYQKLGFPPQLQLAAKYQLPLFLHDRNTNGDFLKVLKANLKLISPHSGVAHSFTGSLQEAKDLLSLGIDIGINGCSLKTEENLRVVKELPLERLHIETDAPYCGIKKTHASYSLITSHFPIYNNKSNDELSTDLFQQLQLDNQGFGFLMRDRNEPATIVQVAECIGKIQNRTMREVVEKTYENTRKLFKLQF